MACIELQKPYSKVEQPSKQFNSAKTLHRIMKMYIQTIYHIRVPPIKRLDLTPDGG
jgi:hypothetical protein